MEKTGIYVHIPFCREKCKYCDFVSFPNREEVYESYINTLIKELDNTDILNEVEISTIFFGGGTPSILPPFYIKKVMDRLLRLKVAKNAEITIEANPESLTPEKLKEYKNAGINRLSIGLQAWQDNLLEKLGRVHRRVDFLQALNWAKKAGFNNINVDLMFAIPGQKFSDWEETLNEVTALNVSHISAYSLILEENTPFYEEYKKGEICLVDEELDRDMYHLTDKILFGKNFKKYEISNYSLSDFYSAHNVSYWERTNYLGFGLAAHSLYNNERYSNTEDLTAYIKAGGDLSRLRISSHTLSLNEQMEEFMFLGLRLTKGVKEEDFYKLFHTKIDLVYLGVIDKHIKSGLLIRENGSIYLSEKGFDLANMVMADFLF
ncbi:MAG: radical SAM family heme chaperone HemW [Clostridiales bacterium]|jgi:oxygen-independent coproporphyrinogen-3 oxidase|nr:radical SAM family heme chaperone HemW [Clostridiales bacterium]